ncbi:hypothetical protein DEU56DRAFT_703189, partial [Suillus clintonianus]|uniref:uncharacterized protein n=1 Tax=Suillus clintonianus TaxID=1904413 RepID=UPI001B85B776
LRSGGLIIELTTVEAAKWIRIEDHQRIRIPSPNQERRYTIIVPFLPVNLGIEDADWRREIEIENGMQTGVIEAAGWIKPRVRRAPGQSVAHATLHFADPSAANLTLRDGIYIGQEKFHPRKDKREPIRCVKCQLWGHMARDCNAPKDVCGTC